MSNSWPHVQGCTVGEHLGLTCLQAERAALDYDPVQDAPEPTMPALDYDPHQHRRRIGLSRAMVASILDLRDDVHIVGMQAHSEPMWVDIIVASARFPIISEEREQRLEQGMTEPTETGPRWREETHDGEKPRGAMQNDREPGWMEGWRLAIEWLREQNVVIGESIPREVNELADEMETRLP